VNHLSVLAPDCFVWVSQRLEEAVLMKRCFDHVDLRVRSLAEARPFYEALLPALGFTRDASIEGWLTYEAAGTDTALEFFGVTESPRHVANECRVAFRADSTHEVDRLAVIAVQAGAGNVEGPAYEDAHYYAVFFEDPSGNRLEICYRERE
jgi:catechol-2,3-dioxygenase